MPQSTTGSVNSQSSGASGASKRSRRYRTVSHTSGADELLFGEPSRNAQMSGNRQKPEGSPTQESRKSGGRRKPEFVQVVTSDLIRTIRVPMQEDPSGQSVILHSGEFSRIRAASHVLSDKDREAMRAEAKCLRQQQQEACADRKKIMEQLEMSRNRDARPSDLEQEANEQSQYLLSKAQQQMEEQEDEIKKLNELILNAKCHAVRDAQLQEKETVDKEMKEEEQRLDAMMEMERQKALNEYEERGLRRHEERLRGAVTLHNQIQDREQQRVLDEEKRDQEQRVMLEYLDRLKLEDMENLEKKRHAQCSLMEDVAKANEEIQRLKHREVEQEKIAEKKVIEFLKAKEEREDAYQRELERQRIEKEKEIARLRALQEREQDKQAEKDALRAKRHQEAYERNWRHKEKEGVLLKCRTEQELKEARERQVQNKERFLAVQAQQDRAEFERVLKAQGQAMKRDEENEKGLHHRRMGHASDVRKQIKEKEQDRVTARKSFFEEGVRLDQEARERREKLNQIKLRKLQELRDAGVPEKYCAEVSRRIHAPPATFSMS